jgi:hypothetical protein
VGIFLVMTRLTFLTNTTHPILMPKMNMSRDFDNESLGKVKGDEAVHPALKHFAREYIHESAF